MNDGEMTRARVICSRRRWPPDSENALLLARQAIQLVEEHAQALQPLVAGRSSVSGWRMFCPP
jgi:hypothetical protein